MLNGIISFSIRNKIVIAALTFSLIVWGTYSLTQLPIDASTRHHQQSGAGDDGLSIPLAAR